MDYLLIIGIAVFIILMYFIVLYLTKDSKYGCKEYCQQGRLPCICKKGNLNA